MLTAPQLQMSPSPDMLIMVFRDLTEDDAQRMAYDALYRARARMPRVTGVTASRVRPVSGRRYFGLSFPREAWYMERGTGPFTMRSLAGKVVPMWITDTDGSARRDNPKARVRSTEDGRTQVLIFRKAAKLGARKMVTRPSKYGGAPLTYTAPAAYPGAPGRINRRNPGAPWTPVGGRGGAIASGNTGVRWRHPGVRAMQTLNSALAEAAFDAGLIVEPVYAVDPASFELVLTRKVA
jgi:hypothetical protein